MTVARAIPERGKRQRAVEKEAAPPDPRRQRLLRDIAMILIAPLLLYLWICLFTYSPDDPGWSTASGGVTAELHNAGGSPNNRCNKGPRKRAHHRTAREFKPWIY